LRCSRSTRGRYSEDDSRVRGLRYVRIEWRICGRIEEMPKNYGGLPGIAPLGGCAGLTAKDQTDNLLLQHGLCSKDGYRDSKVGASLVSRCRRCPADGAVGRGSGLPLIALPAARRLAPSRQADHRQPAQSSPRTVERGTQRGRDGSGTAVERLAACGTTTVTNTCRTDCA
jgi:hypothetical protein